MRRNMPSALQYWRAMKMNEDISRFLIFAGTLIMAYDVFSYLRFAKQIAASRSWKKEEKIIQMPIILLVLFFFGYIGVGLFAKPNLLIASILFGGSLFVWIMNVLIVDIVKKIRENEQIASKLQAAEKASEAKTYFLSNMSHDMRTPLNAISGYTSLGLEAGPEKKDEYLGKIATSSSQLQMIIDDVLEMSRIEAGKLELKKECIDLREVFEETCDLIAAQMKEKKIVFKTSIDIKDRYAESDKAQLSRAISNLLSNACKFTPSDGETEYRITQIGRTDDTGIYEISVKDNGIGMTPEFLNVLFDPFEREVTSSDSGIQGTGLGMPITKNIVELMHGEIHVTSQKGKGSHFVLRIPMKIVRDTGKETKEDLRTDFSGVRTLLCEDNPINMEIASAFLKKYGFILDTAVNGKEAVDKLNAVEEGYYDLVLMDIQMPIMDGYEACKAIRNGTRNKDVKIIAMTANAFKEDKQRAYEAGMNGHIGKPIDIDVMLKTIDDVLKG